MISDLEKKLANIGLQEGVIKSAMQNKKLVERLTTVLNLAKIESCPKQKGK